MSNIDNLSDLDFEALCCDLAGAGLGIKFSEFGPGPDGGIDGRHSIGSDEIILQCKHYNNSSFPQLKAAAKKEAKKLKKLNPSRYLFLTSKSLTPDNVDSLAEIFAPYLKSPDDIWGREDIKKALRKYPEIEKGHIKLWLSSAAVLEKIFNAGLESFTATTQDEILEKVKVYVKNDSFDEAIKRLEKQKVLIISGTPGVGKTTLAEMLCYQYLRDDWKFYSIKTLDDGFSTFDDLKPTIFYFDDFLGRVDLRKESLKSNDNLLASFVRRVQKSKRTRFVLTTRAHIFEEARHISDRVDDESFKLSKYLLDVGIYTRKIRAHIFFNHLSMTEGLTKKHVSALLNGDHVKTIVDHKNYNPRTIAMVSSTALNLAEPDEYPKVIIDALNNPDQIWEKPFKSLDQKCQNLLVTLFFCNEFGCNLETLRVCFKSMHIAVSNHYSQTRNPSDFEDAVKILESGFISIIGDNIDFVNPSVRDFLKNYLVDLDYLSLLPESCSRADWAISIWTHIKSLLNKDEAKLKEAGKLFKSFTTVIETTSVKRKIKVNNHSAFVANDVTYTDRADFLLELWNVSAQPEFIIKAKEILTSPKLSFDDFSEGRDLAALHWIFDMYVSSDNEYFDELEQAIELRICERIQNAASIDELAATISSVKEYSIDERSADIANLIPERVAEEFEATSDIISGEYNESLLNEHMDYLNDLEELTSISSDKAKDLILERLDEVVSMSNDHEGSSYTPNRKKIRTDNFDDAALKSMFTPLLSS